MTNEATPEEVISTQENQLLGISSSSIVISDQGGSRNLFLENQNENTYSDVTFAIDNYSATKGPNNPKHNNNNISPGFNTLLCPALDCGNIME